MFLDLAISVFPSAKLAGGEIQQVEGGLGGGLGAIGPVADVFDHLVESVMGSPAPAQSSPRSFLS